ncbi:MAG: dihydroorotate dehydrogenase [Eubacteriales bacterium]
MFKNNLKVKIAGVELKNPVMTASGTCGFGGEYEEFYSPADLGAIMVKGLTLAPRLGNPTPRIAETPSGILNSIGLQNPGVHVFIEKYLPRLKQSGATVIANIAGSTVEDYTEMARILSATDTDMLELNISCPNVKEGGVAFGVKPEMVEMVTSAVRKSCTKPLIVKLSPNVSDITENARAAQAGGADALSLINTLIGMSIDINSRRPLLANVIGGLSGPAVKPVAVRMVYQVRGTVSLPIIGMGGIASWQDAIEFLLAGADAVAVGTAMFKNPRLPLEIIEGIDSYLTDKSFPDVQSICGLARR